MRGRNTLSPDKLSSEGGCVHRRDVRPIVRVLPEHSHHATRGSQTIGTSPSLSWLLLVVLPRLFPTHYWVFEIKFVPIFEKKKKPVNVVSIMVIFEEKTGYVLTYNNFLFNV